MNISDIDIIIKHQWNVLFVEDNEIIKEQTAKVLHLLFDKIYTAGNGLEGFDIFKDTFIDLVITDMSMPTADGSVLIEKIRAINKEVPIIVMTGHSEFTEIYKGIENIYTIIKPVDLNDLLVSIKGIEKRIKRSKEINNAYSQLQDAQVEARKVLKDLWGDREDV